MYLCYHFENYLCVIGPTIGFANNCTNAFDANINPTSTVSPTSSLCLSSFSAQMLAFSRNQE